MPERVISTKLAIEGEQESREAVKGYTDEYKKLKSELTLVESVYQDNANSMEALNAKGKVLQDMYSNQAKKVEEMRQAMENAKTAEEEHLRASEELRTKIETLKKALNEGEDGFAQISQATGKTVTTTEEAKSAISELKAQLDLLQAKQKAAAKGADDWQVSMNYAKAELNNLGNDVKKNNQILEDNGTETKKLGKSFEVTGEQSTVMGELANKAIGNIAGAFTAAGIADLIYNISQKLIEMGFAFENSEATIIQNTGAQGDALKKLDKTVIDVYGNTSASLQATDDVVSAVSVKLNLSGDAASAASKQFIDFAKATGEDAANSVSYVTDLMYAYGLSAKDIPSILDALTVAHQKSLAPASQLAASAFEGATTFTSYKYSLNGALAQLAAFEKAGINGNTVIKDMAKTLQDISQGGKSWDEIVWDIAHGTMTAADAYKKFGDEGYYLFSVIKAGAIDIKGMNELIDSSSGAMETTAKAAHTTADVWAEAGHKLNIALSPVWNDMAVGAKNIADATLAITNFFETVSQAKIKIGNLSNLFSLNGGTGIGKFISNLLPIDDIKKAISDDSINNFFKNLFSGGKTAVSEEAKTLTAAMSDPEGASKSAQNTTDGYLNTIKENQPGFYKAGYESAESFHKGYAAGSDQHSPSRKAAAQAANDIAGYIKGYKEGQDELSGTASETAAKTIAAYRAAYDRQKAIYNDNEAGAAIYTPLAAEYSRAASQAAAQSAGGLAGSSGGTQTPMTVESIVKLQFNANDSTSRAFAKIITPDVVNEIKRLGLSI